MCRQEKPMPEIHIKLFDQQLDFHMSTAKMRGFVGGRGSGKTVAGAADMYVRAEENPDLYGIYAPTFSDLSRFTLRTFRRIAGSGVVKFTATPIPTLYLSRGAEILCGSLDNPEAGRGPSFRGVWIDEGSLISHDAFINVLGSLRSEGKMGWLSTTFTPKGLQHFTADIFNSNKPDVECFHATTRDNPFAPDEFYGIIRGQVTSAYAEQELEGRFISMSAGFIRREWFKVVPDYPRGARLCRAWDLASTPVTEDNEPDWTAGALVGLHEGVWYIIDVRRERAGPQRVENLIRDQAIMDSRAVPIRIEREGGASGNITIDHYARHVLVGFDFAGVHPTVSKVQRAMPFAAAAEAGNVRIVAGVWNKAFLDELEAFGPDDKAYAHDDQIDAAVLAWNTLANSYIDFSRHDAILPDIPASTRVTDRIAALLANMKPEDRLKAEAMLKAEGAL